MQPAIYAIAGAHLDADERAFFRDADPAGYILFSRNCRDRHQLCALTEDLRALHGRDLPILIDQEGGRVARMRPPAWPEFPAAERFDMLYRTAPISAIEAARLNAAALGLLLRDCGINVDCLPLLDVRQPDGHDIIGDRALGADPIQVAALGRAVLEGLRQGGVAGVLKHLPGHGRATSDSHVALPIVAASARDLEADLLPFERLNWAGMGMVAHIVYTAWDGERPASQSSIVVEEVIRGRIGFDGLLMSDDIGMAALSGDMAERAKAVLAAGCDLVLHCSADMAERTAIASVIGTIGDAGRDRLARAMAGVTEADLDESCEALAARRDALLACA